MVEFGNSFVLALDDIAEVSVGSGQNFRVGSHVVAADRIVVACHLIGGVFGFPVEEVVNGALEKVGNTLDGVSLGVGVAFYVVKRRVA